ncbi:MAG: substrate-binding domain-containing protein [[Clostridium] scindens]
MVVNIADAKNSQSSQNDQVDDFISKGYDAICVNMVDRTVAAVIVDKAKEAGIPIIFLTASRWKRIWRSGIRLIMWGRMPGSGKAGGADRGRCLEEPGVPDR